MKSKLIPICHLRAASAPMTLAQGSLAPPGASAAMMKSLTQVEPRTPISSVPYIISQLASYYSATILTASSDDAITIASSSVTLDLSGFTINSTTLNCIGFSSGCGVDASIPPTRRHGASFSGTGLYASSPMFAADKLLPARL